MLCVCVCAGCAFGAGLGAHCLMVTCCGQQDQQARHLDVRIPNVRFGMTSKADVNFLSEAACVVQVSAEASSIGEIITANRATFQVFGRHQNQLVGDNISTLMPQPFREVHDQFLLRFIETGVRTVMNTTRWATSCMCMCMCLCMRVDESV